jgi:hypothetical protein
VAPVVNSDQFAALVGAVVRAAPRYQEGAVMNEFIGFVYELMGLDEEWRSVFGGIIGYRRVSFNRAQ